MKVISLQSGSNGNCIYVQSRGVRLLLDAGISGLQAERRLAKHGINIRHIDGVIISHDHSDHSRCAGVYHRKFGLKVYATAKTLAAAGRYQALGDFREVTYFEPGRNLDFGSISVATVPTPHDAADGVVFVIASGDKRLGVLTDLGHVFDGLGELVSSLDAVLLESNYDVDMLEQGPYPPMLKRRIAGPGGHISNEESARLLRHAFSQGRLRWACLAHLSEQNNHPQVAMATHRATLEAHREIRVASRYEVSDLMEV